MKDQFLQYLNCQSSDNWLGDSPGQLAKLSHNENCAMAPWELRVVSILFSLLKPQICLEISSSHASELPGNST